MQWHVSNIASSMVIRLLQRPILIFFAPYRPKRTGQVAKATETSIGVTGQAGQLSIDCAGCNQSGTVQVHYVTDGVQMSYSPLFIVQLSHPYNSIDHT